MSEQPVSIEKNNAPVCYRHPDRETWVSCGRCGKPLCPDCVRHGPVGVRCDECLNPSRVVRSRVAPKQVSTALTVASLLGAAWIVILVRLGMHMGARLLAYAPNIAVSCLGGVVIGLAVWCICGKTWNALTARWAFAAAALAPIVSSVILVAMSAVKLGSLLVEWTHIVTTVAAAGLSGLFAWMIVTHEAGDSKLFD